MTDRAGRVLVNRGVVLASVLIIPMAWALHWWTDGLWARAGVYAAVASFVLDLLGRWRRSWG